MKISKKIIIKCSQKNFTENKRIKYCGIQGGMGQDCHVVKYMTSKEFFSQLKTRGKKLSLVIS